METQLLYRLSDADDDDDDDDNDNDYNDDDDDDHDDSCPFCSRGVPIVYVGNTRLAWRGVGVG